MFCLKKFVIKKYEQFPIKKGVGNNDRCRLLVVFLAFHPTHDLSVVPRDYTFQHFCKKTYALFTNTYRYNGYRVV